MIWLWEIPRDRLLLGCRVIIAADGLSQTVPSYCSKFYSRYEVLCSCTPQITLLDNIITSCGMRLRICAATHLLGRVHDLMVVCCVGVPAPEFCI